MDGRNHTACLCAAETTASRCEPLESAPSSLDGKTLVLVYAAVMESSTASAMVVKTFKGVPAVTTQGTSQDLQGSCPPAPVGGIEAWPRGGRVSAEQASDMSL